MLSNLAVAVDTAEEGIVDVEVLNAHPVDADFIEEDDEDESFDEDEDEDEDESFDDEDEGEGIALL